MLTLEVLTRVLKKTVIREEIAVQFPGFSASHALLRSRRAYRTFSANGAGNASAVVSPAMDVDDSFDDDDVDTGDFEDVEADEGEETDD